MAAQAKRPALTWGELLRRKPKLKAVLTHGGYFILGLATGAGRLFGSCGPFGFAAVGASGFGLDGFLCLVGASVGYLLSGTILVGIRYIATSLLMFTVGFVTQGLACRKKRWFMPIVAAVLAAGTGVLYRQETISGIPGMMRMFMEVILSAGCTYFYGLVLEPEKTATEAAELRRTISTAVLAACALMGLASIELFQMVSVGRFLALILVMAAGFCGGPLPGCAAGTALGLGMDMAAGASLFYGAAYALSGLIAGALYRYGRLAFSVAFCAANSVAVLLAWSDGAHIAALYECFVASVLFMLIPQGLLTPMGALLRVGRGRGETAFRYYQARRLEHLSAGFRHLYESAARSEPKHDESGETDAVFDRAADIVCRSCAGKEQCWKKDYAETVQSLRGLTEGMIRRGALTVQDMPVAFRQRCVASEAFVSAVNGELRGLLYRRQYRARLQESRAAAYGQFVDMAAVIGDAAGELGGAAGPDGAVERRLIRFLKAKEVEGSCSAFRDGHGRLHAVLEGAGIEALAEETDYLERLSDVTGVRLCRVRTGEPGRMILRQAEPLAVSVGIASMKKEGENVSGDRGTYFKTDSGRLCVILSDGMGTGERAAHESIATVEILEELLKAGTEPGCAMRLLNSAAMLKNGEDWGYATVDLCCIDLFTGQTSFYKYGAAPSYVKTGRAIRRVRCTSLVAGMLAGEGSNPDMIKMRLRPGNVALIASDGVLAEKNDQWLRDILNASDGMETKALARTTLKTAAERFGHTDDMTALAIRVEERQ
ncbi:MAG: SpoIIE family protein phosphatase [Oscillospiraceae bacterium]|nr:SpoIIE family protein phosphatase [Oscillospiraceae bacterium]